MTDVRGDTQRLGVEAYVFLYPLLTMEITRRQLTNLEPGKRPGFAPANQFGHIRQFPPADFKTVVRPNFDTLYSSVWLDLTGGPVVITAPDTGGRYYLLPMLDMWTDVFASPGWRTSGTGPTTFAVVPQGWSGSLPPGVTPITAPTTTVWLVGRTQTNGPADYDAVHQVQDGFTATPLAAWGNPEAGVAPFAPDPSIDMSTPPLELVNAMSASEFFTLAAELMSTYPPHVTDYGVMERSALIGLRPGAFEPDPQVLADLEGVPAAAQALVAATLPRIARVSNGWSMNTDTVGVYGNSYLKRAIISQVGLGANQPEDAIYPLLLADEDGQPIVGENDYLLHFDAEDLPPVDAFWSLTMYDADGFPAANPLDRFALGDRDPLTLAPDGSLDLYIQHTSPGADKESNWLPAPQGPLGLTLRLYAPLPQALDGRWNPPAIRKSNLPDS
jgi:hypothetical protein